MQRPGRFAPRGRERMSGPWKPREENNPGFFFASPSRALRGMTSSGGAAGRREEAGQPCKYRGKQAKRLKMTWSEWQDSNLRPLRPERNRPPLTLSNFNDLT